MSQVNEMLKANEIRTLALQVADVANWDILETQTDAFLIAFFQGNERVRLLNKFMLAPNPKPVSGNIKLAFEELFNMAMDLEY